MTWWDILLLFLAIPVGVITNLLTPWFARKFEEQSGKIRSANRERARTRYLWVEALTKDALRREAYLFRRVALTIILAVTATIIPGIAVLVWIVSPKDQWVSTIIAGSGAGVTIGMLYGVYVSALEFARGTYDIGHFDKYRERLVARFGEYAVGAAAIPVPDAPR